jgi:long-subunit acyl-CoA synthetase (AMP-forming)
VDNLREIRPTRFVGVPRVWEKVQERLQEVARQSNPLKRTVANWAKSIAAEQHQAVREGRRKAESISYKLAKNLVLR